MRRHFKLLPLLLLLSLFTGCAQKTNRLAEAYSVFSMKPKEFSQIEIANQQLQEQKIVDRTKDIRNILRTLKKAEQLPEVKPELSALSNTYAMKLFTMEQAEIRIYTNGSFGCFARSECSGKRRVRPFRTLRYRNHAGLSGVSRSRSARFYAC